MSAPSSTQITVFLNPEEHALYLIGESFQPTTFTIIDTQKEQETWGVIFVLIHQEKHLILALTAPVTTGHIDDLALGKLTCANA